MFANHTLAKLATTSNITLSGNVVVDTVTTAPGDRVLVKNQTSVSQNGVYIASATAWTLATDGPVGPGSTIAISAGVVNGGTGWVYDGIKTYSVAELPQLTTGIPGSVGNILTADYNGLWYASPNIRSFDNAGMTITGDWGLHLDSYTGLKVYPVGISTRADNTPASPTFGFDRNGCIHLNSTAGGGLIFREPIGSPSLRQGKATLVNGTVTVATTAVTSVVNKCRIFLTRNGASANMGHLYVDVDNVNKTFTITSTNPNDSGDVFWLLNGNFNNYY